jgi:Flp pilus assembly protein TadG
MPNRLSRPAIIISKLTHHLVGLRADQRGTIAVMMGFLLPVLIGGVGVGFEVSNWYMRARAMQNAADAAAIAAASNNSSNYGVEAKAVAAKYGFVDGSNNVTVTPDASNALCPAGLNISPPQQCYKVTITSLVPLYLAQVVGYTGDTTVNGTNGKTLSSAAIATPPIIKQPVCLLGLDPNNQAIKTNGSPNANFSGCTVMSDSAAACNGSNLQAFMGIAVGVNGGGAGCGNIQLSDQQPMPDPFSQMATNIPSDLGCKNSWPQEKKKGGAMSGGTVWNSTPTITNNQIVVCGDLRLSGNVTINAPQPTVLYIENGKLDLNNLTLTTTNVTIVFTGKNNDPGANNYGHYPTDSNGGGLGVLDMKAPTTGNFPGMSIYQNPALTSGDLGLTYSGNSPEWKISGFVYTPNADVTLSGAIDQATNGAQCFSMVAKDVTINGTGSIYAQTPDASACTAAGYKMPTTQIQARGQLVY